MDGVTTRKNMRAGREKNCARNAAKSLIPRVPDEKICAPLQRCREAGKIAWRA